MKKGIYATPMQLLELSEERLKKNGTEEVILWPEGESTAAFEHFCREIARDKYQAALAKLRATGISVAFGGYTASSFLPRSFFDVHPYWFRMDELGVRVTDANFCASSKEAMSYISWRAGQMRTLFPTLGHRCYFLQDEPRRAICHCPACRHLTAEQQRMVYAVAVLEGLQARDGAAEVAYPVYEEDECFPKNWHVGIFPIGTEAALHRHGARLIRILSTERMTTTDAAM